MKKISRVTAAIIFMIMPATVVMTSCGQNNSKEVKAEKQEESAEKQAETSEQEKPLVTFVELGSVRCIPCQQMKPIMESVEKRFGDQVKVVFYDVWTPEGEPYADKYKISVIPTQVFLDKDGVEYFRHEGFFPEAELVKVLFAKGVK